MLLLQRCASRALHATNDQTTCDQIARDRKSKRAWSYCVLCIPFIPSGSPNEYWLPFSSPEPVVSWSRGRETRGSGSSRYRMSENFWHPVAHVQKLQISLLMLITDFCPSPLHWGKNFTSWALSTEWPLWDVLKMHHFSQLGFTDNLELKEEDSNRNQLNTLLVCRTETINRQTIVWVIWVFFFNTFGEQTLGKQYREDRYNAGKSQSKKVSCSMSCNCYLTSKHFLKRNHSCVVLGG